jgi:hypothetical protein
VTSLFFPHDNDPELRRYVRRRLVARLTAFGGLLLLGLGARLLGITAPMPFLMGSFFGLMVGLDPVPPGATEHPWTHRLTFGLVLGTAGGLLFAWLVGPDFARPIN